MSWEVGLKIGGRFEGLAMIAVVCDSEVKEVTVSIAMSMSAEAAARSKSSQSHNWCGQDFTIDH